MPVYERDKTVDDINYLTISQLRGKDDLQVFKNYTDLNGGTLVKDDVVQVTVHIQ